MNDRFLRLATLAALLVAGILAGAQLGKIAPLVGWYQREAGFSLVTIGWLTAMIGIFVALAALPAGWAIERAGTRLSFGIASAVMIVGGFALAYLQSPFAILMARLVEGAGYLVLVIAIPALLNSISPPSWRAPALAIWGGFVPVGFAVADFLAAGLLDGEGPRLFLVTAIAGFAIAAVAATLLSGAVADSVDRRETPGRFGSFGATLTAPVILVSAAFGLYVVLSVAFFAFMPAFIGDSASAIALPAGIIALTVPVGNILTSVLVGGRDARFAAWLGGLGLAVTAAAGLPAFVSTDPLVATVSAVLLAVSGGVVASALFASIPFIVPRGGSASVAIGLVCQAGGIGTVLGPPLAAHVIANYGWVGFGWFLIVGAVAAIACLARLMLRAGERISA